ncbi:MAG: LysR family transcriptional regulator [Clostridia bacterium]|nr:LysR family transcriptional regulator [Clostridia bacterium]
MNSDYIRTFLTVCEVGSFSAAEEKLFISKQAIMKQINLLEKEAGTQLLRRGHRGVSATAAGAVFRHWAIQLIQQESMMLAQTRKAGGNAARLRLVSIDYHVILSPVTTAYTQRYPEVRIETVFHPTTLEAHLVEQDIIDVGDTLFSPEYNNGHLRYEALIDMPYFCISPRAFETDVIQPQALTSPVVDAREFCDYYGFHLEALKAIFPHLEVIHSKERRIAIIYQALSAGKTVVTASTFARRITGFFIANLQLDFQQECGVVYRADAGKEVMDYVALAREIYITRKARG